MKKTPLLILLAALALTACTTNPSNSGDISTSDSSTSEKTSTSEDDPNARYYSKVDMSLTGAELLGQVRDVTVKNHNNYTSYGECRGQDASGGKYHRTDYDPENPDNLIMFYTHDSINVPWKSGATYNREHVWPKSLSCGNWNEQYGGSDLHHIRPTYKDINSARGNKLYGDVNKDKPTKHGNLIGGYTSGNYFEPVDNVKGDVARIILYCFIHYNNAENLQKNDNLDGPINSTAESRGSDSSMPITSVIKGSTSQAFDLLIKWNKLDPVDVYETTRNQGVYEIQGNRNPFIDHPELVEKIWG